MNNMTREEKNEKQRIYRQSIGDRHTKKYEKTVNGFLMRAHRNMRSRAFGVQTRHYHLYSHIINVIDRKEFYEWSKSSPAFASLWDNWISSNYDRRLTPSVDRIDSKGEYVIENMQWITNSENSSKGAKNKRPKPQ